MPPHIFRVLTKGFVLLQQVILAGIILSRFFFALSLGRFPLLISEISPTIHLFLYNSDLDMNTL